MLFRSFWAYCLSWGIFGLVVYILVSAFIGALCWPYAFNTALAWFGRPPTVTPDEGALIGLIPIIGNVWAFVAVIVVFVIQAVMF